MLYSKILGEIQISLRFSRCIFPWLKTPFKDIIFLSHEGEKRLSLMTPVAPNQNNFPYLREGFFLYWNSPRQKWEDIIAEKVTQKYLIIPVYWALHVSGDKIDFGDGGDEKNLKYLIQLAHEYGKKPILAIPVTPNPLVANGGAPSSVVDHFAVSAEGLVRFSIFNQDTFSKLPSFYKPEVYKEYSKFIKKLDLYLKTSSFSYEVVALDFVDIRFNGITRSLFEDFSKSQEDSFEQYSNLVEDEVTNQSLEKLIKDLYLGVVETCFKESFNGALKVSLVGSSFESSMDFIFGARSDTGLNKVLTSNFKNNIFSIVSPEVYRADDLITRQIDELMTPSFLDDCLTSNLLSEEADHFLPMSHIKFFKGTKHYPNSVDSQISSLLQVIDSNLGLSSSSMIFNLNQFLVDDGISAEIVFLIGASFCERDIRLVKKLFYSGQRIILDTNNLDDNFKQEFEMNFSSKSIKKAKLSLEVDLMVYELDSGSVLLSFDSSDLKNVNEEDHCLFWEKIIHAAEIDFLKITGSKDVSYLWRKRSIRPTELSFEEVRRVNFYNPSWEQKIIEIVSRDRFYLLKKIDTHGAKLERKDDKNIRITLAAKGSVALDFGVVE